MYQYPAHAPYQRYPAQAPYRQHPPHAFYQQYPTHAPYHQYTPQAPLQPPYQQYYQRQQPQQLHQGPIHDVPDPYKPQSMQCPAKAYEYDVGLLTQLSANYPPEAARIAKSGNGISSAPAKVGVQATGLRREVEAREDQPLRGWSSTWFKLLVDGLSDDVSSGVLAGAFTKYQSFKKACVVRDRSSQKADYGFVAFSDPEDFLKAWKEMEGKYVGKYPIRLKRADTVAIGPADAGYYHKPRQRAW